MTNQAQISQIQVTPISTEEFLLNVSFGRGSMKGFIAKIQKDGTFVFLRARTPKFDRGELIGGEYIVREGDLLIIRINEDKRKYCDYLIAIRPGHYEMLAWIRHIGDKTEASDPRIGELLQQSKNNAPEALTKYAFEKGLLKAKPIALSARNLSFDGKCLVFDWETKKVWICQDQGNLKIDGINEMQGGKQFIPRTFYLKFRARAKTDFGDIVLFDAVRIEREEIESVDMFMKIMESLPKYFKIRERLSVYEEQIRRKYSIDIDFSRLEWRIENAEWDYSTPSPGAVIEKNENGRKIRNWVYIRDENFVSGRELLKA